jgi:hypothetical protein
MNAAVLFFARQSPMSGAGVKVVRPAGRSTLTPAPLTRQRDEQNNTQEPTP